MLNLRNATLSGMKTYQTTTLHVIVFVVFSANYEYAAVCLPEAQAESTHYCYVHLLSNTTANVQIHRIGDSESFSLPAGEVYKREYDDFPTIGVESKAIRITSDVAIQVLVYKVSSNPQWNDAYMVHHQIGDRCSYFTTADNHNCGFSSNNKHFYLLTSFYDNTSVNITQQDGISYHLDLPEFGTFVRKTVDFDAYLAIGTQIISSKPINVISGNLCTEMPSGGFYGTYLSSIPDITSLSKEYIVPRLVSETSDPGYTVTIVATQDNTIVDSDGDVSVLDEGEAAIFDYDVARSIFVTCSKTCLVAQIAKFQAFQDEHGNFMQTILAEADFSTYAFFTAPDPYPRLFLSLVVKGESPGDDIFLNGTSLGSLDWTAINGFSSAEMSLDHGVYELYSMDSRPFAAYVYQHLMYRSAGVGYTILPSGLSWTPPPTEPTTPELTTEEPTTPEITTEEPENYEYAAVCLPETGSETEYCYVHLLSSTTANVEIHHASDSESFSLPAGEVYEREYRDFPNIGVESKAIRIISDVAIQVLVYKTSTNPRYNDVYMVPSQIGDRSSYFTVADSNTCNSGSNYNQFYLVTSFYDNTSVNITQQDGTTYHVDLPTFGTFTQKTQDGEDHLAIGTKIISSKPVNVISGDLCAMDPSLWFGTYLSSIPESTSLSKEYVVPKLISETSNPGYTLTIIATEDNTIVDSDGSVRILDEGEAAMFNYFGRSIFVNCSKPCLVAQTARSELNKHGSFMQTMLAESDFSTFAFFTTPDLYPTSFLTLVVEGDSPGKDIYLNGASLESLDWTAIGGFSSAEMSLDHGVYELYSTDGRLFAAYVYQHTMSYTGGLGYALLQLGLSWIPPTTSEPITSEVTTSEPSTEPTTPPSTPRPSAPLPQHAVRVNGTTYTADGLPMTPQCAVVSKTVSLHNIVTCAYIFECRSTGSEL